MSTYSRQSMGQRRPPPPHPVRVNWILIGDRRLASSRLQGYVIHEYLSARRRSSRILSSPPFYLRDAPWQEAAQQRQLAQLLRGEVVVFQKLQGPNAEALAGALRHAGAKIVYIHCDYEPDNSLPLMCDAIVCTSQYLADFYRQRGAPRVLYIPDPAEVWCDRSDLTGGASAGDEKTVRLCWMGSHANWESLRPLRQLLAEREFSNFRLITVSDHREADVKWELNAARSLVEQCDIGVIPTGQGAASFAKSSNRAVHFMAAGRPVIADRIPAYEEVIENGRNGYLCDAPEDWRRALRALMDAGQRRDMALRAYDSVDPKYRIETIGERYLDLFESLYEDDAGAVSLPAFESPARPAGTRLIAAAQLQALLAHEATALSWGESSTALSVMRRAALLAPAARGGLRLFGGFHLRAFLSFVRKMENRLLRRNRKKPVVKSV